MIAHNECIARYPKPLRFINLVMLILFALSPASSLAGTSSAQQLTNKMLDRLGGRANWAELKNTINGSKQNRVEAPTEVYSVITMDFEKPRFRLDTTTEDINLIRVINAGDSWRISWSGQVEGLPAERFDEDMRWYQAHIYRTIHRIAAKDPRLTLRLQRENHLEVYQDEERLLWLKLDAMGEPYAFGFREDNVGSLSGPWDVEKSGVRHPAWVSSADGTWRAQVKMLQFNVKLLDSMFARPIEPERGLLKE